MAILSFGGTAGCHYDNHWYRICQLWQSWHHGDSVFGGIASGDTLFYHQPITCRIILKKHMWYLFSIAFLNFGLLHIGNCCSWRMIIIILQEIGQQFPILSCHYHGCWGVGNFYLSTHEINISCFISLLSCPGNLCTEKQVINKRLHWITWF